MKIYLVRHGQSEANAQPIVQGNEGSLSELGRKQAEFLAQRLEKLSIDLILCSTLDRTRETAAIIQEKLKAPIEYSDLLVEKRYPSEIVGRLEADEDVLGIRRTMKEHFGEPGWRYSDEENFEDFKSRCLKAFDLFANSGKENVLVVTHGLTMRMLLMCAIIGSDLSPQVYRKILNSTLMKNTGITVLEERESVFDGDPFKRWCLVTWNDHAHLENI